MRAMFMSYYRLTKPGIIRGNVMATAAGFLLASAATNHTDLPLLAAVLGGTSLVIAAACVFNNYIDRGIDHKMARTKQRALVSGAISPQNALVYGSGLGILGFVVLAAFANLLVVAIGAFALAMYVAVYGYFKRRTAWGTLVGCVPGALPPVAGYAAVSGRLDLATLLLFLILVLWQMPHFYAIALYRLKDYKAAGLPVFPAVHGARKAKMQILSFIVVFTVLNLLLTVFGYTGYIYAIVMVALGIGWFTLGARNFSVKPDELWGKSMFLFSLIIILSLSVMLSVGGLLA